MRVEEADVAGRDLLKEMKNELKVKITRKEEEELEMLKQEFKIFAKDLL